VATLPNRLTRLRLVLSPTLPLVALLGRPVPVVLFVLFLQITDWIDGPLARRQGTQSEYGARLDSLADLTMFLGLGGAVAVLRGDTLLAAWPWLVAAAASYAASTLFSRFRFGVWPAYHPWTAKISGPISLAAAMLILLRDEAWPVRVAASFVTLANIEGVLITAALDGPRTDVGSVWTLRRRRASETGSDGGM
jgi:CDP-diacylglycerol--glycerol-3-phosphate 3-phosphatidyltransferase